MATRVSKTPLFKKSLHDVIRGIRSCKDPETTDKYIREAISECRQECLSQDMDVKTMAVIKLAYLQMLGHDMSWASFHVLEVMSSAKFAQKRIGYLAAMQSFGQDTDVLMLTTNLLKKDLASRNHLDVALAISGISNIVSPSLARDLAEDLIKMMNHSKPYVRKKAVLVMYKIFLQFPEALRSSFPRLREKLEDPEITVVSATVNVICELAKKHPKNYLPLAPQLFNILTTSSNNWMLIKIIKLFASLAPIEPRLKAKIIPPITNIIQTTTAMSLLYECINCIVSGGMLSKDDDQLAIMCVNKLRVFFEESDQNLKFVGLLAYTKIVVIHPLLVAQHADVIMDCMDDQDISIRQRAVELAVYLVNPDTLFDVVKRLMLQLIPQSRDQVLPERYRIEVIRRILDMCSNNTYANVSNFEWYVAVLVDLVKISEGLKEVGAEIGIELQNVAVRVRSIREYAVASSARLVLDRDVLLKNAKVLKYAAWIVGEYAVYLDNHDAILDGLLRLEPRTVESDTEAVCIQAIPKVYSVYAGSERIPWTNTRSHEIFQLTERIVLFLEKYSTHMDIEVQERSVEFLELFRLIVMAIRERPDDDNDLSAPPLITQVLPNMFNAWELNPVSTKAQKRIPIPAGLDLDEEFNQPVIYSESEDEDEIALREQLLMQQQQLSSHAVNSAQPDVSRKSVASANNASSEEEELKEKRKRERRVRQADDPYYILESEKIVRNKKSTADSESDSELESRDRPMKDEELDIDSIPIMKLEIASLDVPPKKSSKSKKRRAKVVPVEIIKEETFGDEGEVEVDNESDLESRRQTVLRGSTTQARSSLQKKGILRVDARGLEGYDLEDADADELGKQEVEKFKAEILAARQKSDALKNDHDGVYDDDDDEHATTRIVVKKKKKAKVVKKVKKVKKDKKEKSQERDEKQDTEKLEIQAEPVTQVDTEEPVVTVNEEQDQDGAVKSDAENASKEVGSEK
ncbi:adaptin N terminal region-domain-containing protein [Lipomyces japonicus]|uniref:adaptin N terminal region-domain-containing protein n=1 Tax=Lipomyces japonicus TaxID=56871 RepID=UPI0034CF0C50